MIGIAETGSGKTAAFCIPMISYILSLPSDRRKCIASEGPLACIMAPTRELALQIHEECLKFAKYTGLKMACIVGGQDIEVQGFLLGQVRVVCPPSISSNKYVLVFIITWRLTCLGYYYHPLSVINYE